MFSNAAEDKRYAIMHKIVEDSVVSTGNWSEFSKQIPSAVRDQLMKLKPLWDREATLNEYIQILQATPFQGNESSPLLVYPVEDGKYATWRIGTFERARNLKSGGPLRIASFFKEYMDNGNYKVLVITLYADKDVDNRDWIVRPEKSLDIYISEKTS